MPQKYHKYVPSGTSGPAAVTHHFLKYKREFFRVGYVMAYRCEGGLKKVDLPSGSHIMDIKVGLFKGFVKHRSRDSDPFRSFCRCFDVIISPTSPPLPRRLEKSYFDVMTYMTFSREIGLTLCKLCTV